MFLILGPRNAYGYAESNPAYRGTYREHPYGLQGPGDDPRVNRAFLWFLEEGGQEGVVHNLEKARELVEAYKTTTPPQFFEIIEPVADDGSASAGTTFLGYDLSGGGVGFSLLARDLHLTSDPGSTEDLLFPFFRLIESYFRPRLNQNRLFDHYETAEFCLSCMKACQKFSPGLWENDDVVDLVMVTKLYRVD